MQPTEPTDTTSPTTDTTDVLTDDIVEDAQERERALAEEMEMLGVDEEDGPCLIGWRP